MYLTGQYIHTPPCDFIFSSTIIDSSLETPILLQIGEGLNKSLIKKVIEWKPIRETSIKMLKEIPDKIDRYYKNTNITRIVGASTAIAGGVLTVAGTVGSFFTFGLAAPVAGIGVALAVSGGGAAAGASVADIIVTRLNLPVVQKQLDIDGEKTEKLIETINQIDEIAEVIVKRFPHVTRKAVLEILLGASNTSGRGIVVARPEQNIHF